MQFLGLEIHRSAAKAPALRRKEVAFTSVDGRGGWRRLISEAFPTAWQRNVELRPEEVLSNPTVYACITLIAGDIGKLRPKLMEQLEGYTDETTSAAFSPVLRRPNHYQTRIDFFEHWTTSKLSTGNTYALKVRDERRVVVGLYILDPRRVSVLVSTNGDVYYRLLQDDLSRIGAEVVVPASEIIHDLMNPLFHPLCGVSPLFAGGLPALAGLRIHRNSERFFGNFSQPGGILTAPDEIDEDIAKRLKQHWEENYTGDNVGRVAVLGDGLKYEAITVNAAESQMSEQLKASNEAICSVFHVPPYMVGVGPMPTYTNIESLTQQYYSQCLQKLIEKLEENLGYGLALPTQYGIEFDLDGLLRMDTATRYKAYSEGVKGGWMMPNEPRRKEGLKPIKGGDTAYMQQQNWSLDALDKRGAVPDKAPVAAAAAPPALPPPQDEGAKLLLALERKFIEAEHD